MGREIACATRYPDEPMAPSASSRAVDGSIEAEGTPFRVSQREEGSGRGNCVALGSRRQQGYLCSYLLALGLE